MKRLSALVALLPLLLAACDNKPAAEKPAQTQAPTASTPATPTSTNAADPSTVAFQHDPTLDVFGYYSPRRPSARGTGN